jgi:hypothetical protein
LGIQKNTGTELAKQAACDQVIAEHTYKRKLGSHFRKETSLIPAGMVSQVFAKKPGQFPTQLPHCEKKFKRGEKNPTRVKKSYFT